MHRGRVSTKGPSSSLTREGRHMLTASGILSEGGAPHPLGRTQRLRHGACPSRMGSILTGTDGGGKEFLTEGFTLYIFGI